MFKRNVYEERKQQRALRARERRSERRSIQRDTQARIKANESHRTYQSFREPTDKGWMPQWITNKVLGMWGDR